MRTRIRFPNVVAIVSGLVMTAAMRLPWWILTFEWTGTSYIYPYLISGPASEVVGYKRRAQMQILTYLLVACIILSFLGSVLRGWKGRLVLGAAGALALLAVWRFVARITSVASGFSMPIQGHGMAYYSGFEVMPVSARLGVGLYLMVAGAVLCLLASLLHNWLRPCR